MRLIGFPPPMLLRCGMDGGCALIQLQSSFSCATDARKRSIGKATTAPTAERLWIRRGYERTEYERTNYVFCCCYDYVGFKPENDIGIKTFVDNYRYCRSCGSRMLGVVEFRAK